MRWSLRDRLLYAAVTQLESEKCPDCGLPIWHAHTTDSRVEFDLDFHVCYACQTKAEKTKDIKLKDGEWASVKVTIPKDEEGTEYPEDLPTRAEGLSSLGRPVYATS